jgi:putative ABC transport system permease protein
MGSLWLDVHYALRRMAKSPGFTAILAITLAVGIGASTTIFSVVESILLRPLPYDQPDRLVRVFNGVESAEHYPLSPPEIADLRRDCRTCGAVASWARGTASFSGGDRPLRVDALFGTAELLPLLGVKPLLGRFYDAREDRPGEDPRVVVIGYDLWQRAFGGDRSVIGKKIRLDAYPVTVIGVMPKGFDFLDRAEAWAPANLDVARARRDVHSWHAIVRLAPGATVAAFRSELAALTDQWARAAGPGVHTVSRDHPLYALPLQESLVGGLARPLWLLQGAVLFVLLISIVNVANLLIARANMRTREVAVRHALGASRRRLLRQFVTESLVLGALGGGLGLVVAMWALDGVTALIPSSAPRAAEIRLDGAAIAFAVVASVFAAVLFGLAPIVHARRTDLHGALKEGGDRALGSRARLRVRRALVITEVALAVVLVVGCALMVRSFVRLSRVDLGMNPDRLLVFGIEVFPETYPGTTADAFWHRLEDRVRAVPGVEDATLVAGLPPQRGRNDILFDIPGRTPPPTPEAAFEYAYRQWVGTHALETLGARLVRGRTITERDTADAPKVVLVNEAFVREFFPNQDPIGQRINARPTLSKDDAEQTIVGVVADIRQGGLDQPAGSEAFLPVYQLAGFGAKPRSLTTLWVVVRAKPGTDPRALTPAIQQLVADLDPTVPLFQVRTMDDVLWDALARPRFIAFLLTCFAGIALLLATVGVFGLMAHTVAERTREIGLRLALGALPAQVRTLVLRQALALVAAGVAVGVATAIGLQLAFDSWLRGIFYGGRLSEPLLLGGVSVVVAATALLATWIPVRRATRVEPNVVLRSE